MCARKYHLKLWCHSMTVALSMCLLVVARPGYAAGTLTLDEYFAQALVRSEVVATQSELIRQAEERYRQAGAALYPTVSGVASYTWQDSGARDITASPTRQPFARLTATQPMFRGFREFAAMRQRQALVDAQGDDYQNARVQLFKDVAQNFYDVLTLEQDLKNLDEQIEQYQAAREGAAGTRAHRPLASRRSADGAGDDQHTARAGRAAQARSSAPRAIYLPS